MASKMVLINLLKVNIFFLVTSSWRTSAETGSNHPSNTVATRELFLPEIPQVYYTPYQKYISPSAQKYVPPAGNQIPIGITSTEKSIPSPAYKLALDSSKYAIAQGVTAPQGAQGTPVGYPYLYALATGTPSTTAKYPTPSRTPNDVYEETPKKYHYGYRVSNPHTGAEFGHSEVNDGISARGYYHVLLPDGRLQNVKYWAGPSGYHATITYESQY